LSPHLKYVTALPCEIPKSDFQVYHLLVSEYFGYLLIKRTQCQSAAEIITVYIFSRLLLPAYDVTEVSEEKARATTVGSESVKSP